MGERYICTREAPWTPDVKGPVSHPDAKEVEQRDGKFGGDLLDYECPNCGKHFTVELPQ